MGHEDKPAEVREGEAFDVGRMETFIKDNIPGLDGALSVKQFPSGFSNLTYMLKIGDRELVMRRPPFGKKAKTAHDMSREYRILRSLKPVFPYVPEPLLYCDDPEVIGSTFYIMERFRGVILRRNFPRGLHLSEEEAGCLCENWVDVLVTLHGFDYKKIGLGDFGKPDGYVRRQVEGWSARYRDAYTDDAPDFEEVMQWLRDHMPDDSPAACVVHNDYKFDNVVLAPDNLSKIIGVLDWEMATIGDPLMDLGASLAYWVTSEDPEEFQIIRTLPTVSPGMLNREQLVESYLSKTGRTLSSFDFYLCFGLFRLAGIAQQIYYRFYHGQTRDERFGMLIV
ncbi:MAG: phosphotransferase family protein, partial [Deltaproteobacteria bacterium]|nr:phosphotransferase family protein [Deltaproteobacteria bacterium]